MEGLRKRVHESSQQCAFPRQHAGGDNHGQHERAQLNLDTDQQVKSGDGPESFRTA